MDANLVHNVAATLRDAAELLDQPIDSEIAKVAEETVAENLDSQEVLNFLKFFG